MNLLFLWQMYEKRKYNPKFILTFSPMCQANMHWESRCRGLFHQHFFATMDVYPAFLGLEDLPAFKVVVWRIRLLLTHHRSLDAQQILFNNIVKVPPIENTPIYRQATFRDMQRYIFEIHWIWFITMYWIINKYPLIKGWRFLSQRVNMLQFR